MKVSVIIPAHNEKDTIGAAIESLRKQDFKDFEIIVIDNASTDNTSQIVQSLGVKVVSEERKGTMWACEKGRKEAKGDIVVRMDADCLPNASWLSKGIHIFDSDSTVVAVTGPYDYFDTPFWFRSFSFFAQSYLYGLVNYIVQKTKHGAVLIGGNSFMRADALSKMGGFNTDITFYGDDTDTAKRIAPYGKVVFSSSIRNKTSGRRFKKEGYLLISWKYVKFFLKTIFQPN